MADLQPQEFRPPQGQPPNNHGNINNMNNQQNRQEPNRYSTTKYTLIACLGGMALLLGCMIAVVQLQINQAHRRLLEQSKEPPRTTTTNTGSSGSGNDDGALPKTTAASEPTRVSDLYLSQLPQNLPDSGSSRSTAAQAYWNRFVGITSPAESRAWNPVLDSDEYFDFRSASAFPEYDGTLPTTSVTGENSHHQFHQNSTFAETKLMALKRAAQLGHPQAQHVYANALASGVLPLYYEQSSLLEVADEFLNSHTQQQQEAWLNWHMAAISGNVEAAMALAHRYETLRKESELSSSPSSSSSSKRSATDSSAAGGGSTSSDNGSFQCEDVLPYYQAAAHGIMDKLEVSSHSRAKVLPPTEKHLLYQVHLHGGTSSQLDWHNKPDESMEAIQFYHFKATRAVDPEPNAAVTLATLYHFGYRGVTQNLTLALQYYDIAARANSWEAAGYAGWFHIFGLGMQPEERNLYQAAKYFRQGIPRDLKDCQDRYQKKKRFKQQDSVILCDPNCLNGMGLLSVLGVPLAVEVDLAEAIEYFTLAKEMGHADAAYNLAMITLGWKSHYVPLFEAQLEEKRKKQEQPSEEGIPNKMATAGATEDTLNLQAGPSQLDMQHVVQYLMIAVQKGHLQARHRLALLYDTGVLSSPDKSARTRRVGHEKEVLPQDCDKALRHYKWIVDQASPHMLNRLRKAYKDYIAGDLEASLIQYMSIAELGSEVAQVNAAFLLEQGTCLGLSSIDCHKASVRYWKAAATAGNAEACLRVGDFYYYGKLRPPQDPLCSLWDRPFGWVHHLIFPEKYWLPALFSFVQRLTQEAAIFVLSIVDPSRQGLGSTSSEDEVDDGKRAEKESCVSNEVDGTCSAASGHKKGEEMNDASHHHTTSRKEDDERDLKMSAHFYRIAAEKHQSPRAHFNLAFLHEWGLGLTQDFPLAKRHYDLAASNVAASREADLAVQIALWTMALHEYVVRMRVAWEDYWSSDETDGDITGSKSPDSGWNSAADIIEAVPRAITNIIGKPVPGPTKESSFMHDRNEVRKTKTEIILKHLWSWESLLILILTIILWILLQRRRQRTRR